ncbi:M48 family metallopeptidase [Nakamurella sp. PAMC28650]|uniref:M48 family metallopeptidase n=1 Tax=Nakamurella sp. PAMC28650 TaxID=2762325 RepID=UPI00164D6879|nr:M48 family metallopeptidase [Nakamurella sp. PAMC28650]QNK79818.1 M48 family metallopeptidase [Nakamurella sp. PAMC28650]
MARTVARKRLTFPGISSRAWEHPADRSALVALRAVPGFDTVLKALAGLFRERKHRLIFLASAVKVSDRQFAEIDRLFSDALLTLDSPRRPELYIRQDPAANAMCIGMDEPFIVVTTGLIELLDDPDELRCVLGHELGHAMSGHAVYQTMLFHLLRIADNFGWMPLGGLALRAIIAALYEWSRKAEQSADRAGMLVAQDPQVSLRVMMKMAGGASLGKMDTVAFLEQAAEYEGAGDIRDGVLKLMNLERQTHPFSVVRAAEIRKWVETGDYQAIMAGDYPRRADDSQASIADELKAAARSYRDGFTNSTDPLAQTARNVGRDFGGAAQNVGQNVADGLTNLWKRFDTGDPATETDQTDEPPADKPKPGSGKKGRPAK